MTEKRSIEKKKKNDRLLIVVLLLLALVSLAAMKIYQKKSTHDAMAVVTVDGEEYGQYPLDEDAEVTIPAGGDNYNVLVIKDGYADIIEATCPDKICVDHAKINGNGQTLVCLPNKVVVEIVNQDEEASEVDLSTN